MKKPNVTCEYCHDKFYRSPSNFNKSTFCSRVCYGKSMKGVQKTKNKRCKYCGVKILGHQKHKKVTKYCSQRCYFLAIKSPFIIKNGYKKILMPDHPRSDGKGYVFDHIIIIESKLGRPLHKGEVTHHIDKNKLNNAPENLISFENNTLHLKNGHSASS